MDVTSFDGTLIRYDLYPQRARSLVLIVPGFWRERRHPSLTRLASMLLGHGYAAAIMDVRGHGESGGTYGFNLHEHHDLAAVCRDLTARLSVQTIAIIGFSYGGSIAISATARHSLPVASLILISAVADFAMIAPRFNPFAIHRHIAFRQAFRRPRFDWHVRRSEKLRAVDDVSDVHAPLCLIHVKDDWLIGHSHSEALFARANEPKELHVLDIAGNYHADRIFSIPEANVDAIVEAFLNRYTPP